MALTFLRGFDGGCELSVYCSVPESFKRYLYECKQTAIEREDRITVNYQGIDFQVLPTGVVHRREGAAKGVTYDYQIFFSGMYMLVRHKQSQPNPSIRLKFTYTGLRDCDLFEKWRQVKSVLQNWGVEVQECRPHRIDYQVTTDKFTVDDIYRAKRENRLILNGREFQTIEGATSINTIYISRGQEMEICVYNKSREMSSHWDDQKIADCVEVLGVPLPPDNLTRLEFRYRREFLRKRSIHTIEDLEKSFTWLLERTLETNFRILEKPRSVGNEWRQKTSDLYKLIVSLMFGSDSLVTVVPPKKSSRSNKMPSRYFRAAMGYFTSGLALQFASEIVELEKREKRSRKLENEKRPSNELASNLSLSLFGLYHKYSVSIVRLLARKVNDQVLALRCLQ